MLAFPDADPRSGMGSIWEVVPIPAHLAEQDFDAPSRESRHGIDPFHEGIKPA